MTEPSEIVDFWRKAGPDKWFAKDEAFDAEFKQRFHAVHDAAARRELDGWMETPDGALALCLLSGDRSRLRHRSAGALVRPRGHRPWPRPGL